jgi:hypothetical protein
MKASAVLAIAALAILMVSTMMALAEEEVELIQGEFRDGRQHLAVRNNTTLTIEAVAVNCGFFRDNVLVEASTTMIHNVLPGQMGYNYTSSDAGDVTSVDCRIEEVYR